jgi:hypothetical protein
MKSTSHSETTFFAGIARISLAILITALVIATIFVTYGLLRESSAPQSTPAIAIQQGATPTTAPEYATIQVKKLYAEKDANGANHRFVVSVSDHVYFAQIRAFLVFEVGKCYRVRFQNDQNVSDDVILEAVTTSCEEKE